MIFHVKYAAATEPLDPNPIGTPLEDGYWDFNEGDIYAWTYESYEDGILMNPNQPPGIMNISEITYEDASSHFSDAISEYFYNVKVKQMFWNGSINSLQEFSNEEAIYGVAINITNEEIYSDAPMNCPLFIPYNDSGVLALHWIAEAYNKTVIPFKTKIDVDTAQRIISIIDDITEFDFYFTFKYDLNGVLENFELFVNEEGYTSKQILNRSENLNPIDEIEWSVKKGDEIYIGLDTNEIKIDIVDIVNYTNEGGWTTQLVAVNASIWDPSQGWVQQVATEDITDRDKIFAIGEANEYLIQFPSMGNLIYPIGTTGEDLAKAFNDTRLNSDVCNFDNVKYGDYWVYIEEINTGKYNNYSFFPNGIIKEYYEEFEFWYYDIYEEISFTSGYEFIWEITELDEIAMENVFGVDWANIIQYDFNYGEGAVELGARMQIYIYDIYEGEENGDEGWEIHEDIWNWTTEAFEEEPDLYDVKEFLYMEPDAVEDPPAWFCPKYDDNDDEILSVNEYLDNIDYYNDWENEGNKVELNMSAVLGYNANITLIYDEITGAVQTLQIENESSDIIYEIQLITYTFDPHWEDDSGYPQIMYYKNVTSLTSGANQVNFTALGIGMTCNFTIDIETNDDAEVLFSSFTHNPSEEPLDDAILYFDLFLSDPSKIEFPINITIEIPETLIASGKILKIYYYNETTEEWQEVNYTLVGNKISITIYHASIFSITATIPLIPREDDDGNGKKKTKGEAIPGYDVFTLLGIISIITVILLRSLRKSKKF